MRQPVIIILVLIVAVTTGRDINQWVHNNCSYECCTP